MDHNGITQLLELAKMTQVNPVTFPTETAPPVVITDSEPVLDEPVIADCRCGNPECTIPYGTCHCGCGGKTTIKTVKNQRVPSMFLRSHNARSIDKKFRPGRREGSPWKKSSDRKIAKGYKLAAGMTDQELHRRAVLLWEAMRTHANDSGVVVTNIDGIVDQAGIFNTFLGPMGKPTRRAIRDAFAYLTTIKAIDLRGPTAKVIVAHPNELRPDVADQVFLDSIADLTPTSKTSDITASSGDIPVESLANALAQAMWERYEWALNEIGKLAEQVAVLQAENRRLRETLNDNASLADIAKRIIRKTN